MFGVPNTTKFWQGKSFQPSCMLSNINGMLISPNIPACMLINSSILSTGIFVIWIIPMKT